MYAIGGLVALFMVIYAIRSDMLFFMWSDLENLTVWNQINVIIVTGIILWFSTLAHEFGHLVAANITAYRLRKDDEFLREKPIAKIVRCYYLNGRVESPVYEFLTKNRIKYEGLIRINSASGHALSLIYWVIFIIAFSVIGSNYFILCAFAWHHGFLAISYLLSDKTTSTSDMVCVLEPDKFIYTETESRNTLKDLFAGIGLAIVNILFATLLRCILSDEKYSVYVNANEIPQQTRRMIR